MTSLRCVIVFCMLISGVASAQDIMRLQDQLQGARTDQQKIDALDALANYYTWTEGGYDEAKSYGEKMIALAKDTKNNELIALTYILNGIRLVEGIPSTERENELRNYFDSAIQISKINNMPFYEACAYIGLSGIQFHVVHADGDEMLKWGKDALKLSTAVANDSLRSMSLIAIANGYRFKKNNIIAFRHFSEAIEMAEKMGNPYPIAYCYRAFARFYDGLGDPDKAIAYFSKAIETLKKKKKLSHHDLNWLYFTQWNASLSYMAKNDYKNARGSINKVIELSQKYHLPSTYSTALLFQLLTTNVREGKYEDAKSIINQNPNIESFFRNHDFESAFFKVKATLFKNTQEPDSADYYYRLSIASLAKSVPVWAPGLYNEYGNFLLERNQVSAAIKQLEIAKSKSEEFKDLNNLVSSYKGLDAAYYKAGDVTKAYQYKSFYNRYKDSLDQVSKEKDLALLEVQGEQKRKEQQQLDERANAEYRNRIRTYSLLAGLVVLLMIAAILYKNNRQKQKANVLLKKEKEKTEQALRKLEETQAQLIQAEKMASLGELTAGIAHEIQNPLNFVNNFSEVNSELIDEMQQKLNDGNNKEAIEISNDIRQNQEKINHHGKRADAIVKGMLQHSRSSSGVKEPTDINALADEYLRLAYHGLRAKDKSFNATMKTNYDKDIGNINVIPQDIGRVILNLITNAFYAVMERKNQNLEGFEPTVTINTKKLDDRVEIKVGDNGVGIPQKVLDKIFQPFFTTKPAGHGTGLGLSLSYDIIKAHGGEIKVETDQGEGSVFSIMLPVSGFTKIKK